MSLFADMADIFTSTFSRGEVVVVTPVGGAPRDLTGRAIFRRAGLPIVAGDLDMVTTGPELHLAEPDALGLDADASATVDGQAFTVTQRLVDGRSMVRLMLREA